MTTDAATRRASTTLEPQRETGVFAALLAELRAEADSSHQALAAEAEGSDAQIAGERAPDVDAVRYLVQLPLPGLGARPLIVAQEEGGATRELAPFEDEGERWTTREAGRNEQRPGMRRRQERFLSLKAQSLRARRERPRRTPVEPIEVGVIEESAAERRVDDDESGPTRCVRASFRVVPHEEVVLVRRSAERSDDPRVVDEPQRSFVGDRLALEIHELDAPVPWRPRDAGEVCRHVVFKSSGALAHLRALDRALAVGVE